MFGGCRARCVLKVIRGLRSELAKPRGGEKEVEVVVDLSELVRIV